MFTLFSQRNTRCTAIVMLFVWLMALGVGIANACVIDLAQSHHSNAYQSQVTRHVDERLQPLAADKQACLDFCANEQSAAVKAKQQEAAPSVPIVPVIWLSAITVALADPSVRPTPASTRSVHERPVAIRYLRLTI